ncbi:cysteine proteinase inhibitor 1-like [Eucalyptus grandis]|uniref:cysteine proteinase inhibitor 1-like n=1 Tax=Eucalyptus grandis TaxID=71139 RepID=UPI00192EED67|nr:cysteine proteinase inhibitor 1-like [Eucalyptus grandis]
MRLLVLAAVATTVLLLQGSAAKVAGKEGPSGWEPIKDLSDPHVREIAEFAINKHNEDAQTKLALDKVVKGETVGFLGTIYKLIVEVKDGANPKSYEAVVWDGKLVRFLVLFKAVEGNV